MIKQETKRGNTILDEQRKMNFNFISEESLFHTKTINVGHLMCVIPLKTFTKLLILRSLFTFNGGISIELCAALKFLALLQTFYYDSRQRFLT